MNAGLLVLDNISINNDEKHCNVAVLNSLP